MNEKVKVKETNTQRIKQLENEVEYLSGCVEKLQLHIMDITYDIKMLNFDIRRLKK